MRYLKAIALAGKPYIQWDLWANTFEELEALGESSNPLIIAEDQVPDFIYGVSPWVVEGDELVERTPAEMENFEAEYTEGVNQSNYRERNSILDVATFEFNSRDFPMHQTARLYYDCIDRSPGNYKVMSINGITDVFEADLAGFFIAYYDKLKQITQP